MIAKRSVHPVNWFMLQRMNHVEPTIKQRTVLKFRVHLWTILNHHGVSTYIRNIRLAYQVKISKSGNNWCYQRFLWMIHL